jgi:hypothetical protein
VSFRTVQDLYAGIQESTRRISVPADMLAKLTNIAGRALSEEDARAWPLVCLQYPTVADALADIDWLRLQLAATPPRHVAGRYFQTESLTMNNDTLNALILRHGDSLLRRSGGLKVSV